MNCSIQELEELSFALDELRLFLDTHPQNAAALDFYNQVQRQREASMMNAQARFGPLAFYQKTSPTSWEWVEQPFPWEMEE